MHICLCHQGESDTEINSKTSNALAPYAQGFWIYRLPAVLAKELDSKKCASLLHYGTWLISLTL